MNAHQRFREANKELTERHRAEFEVYFREELDDETHGRLPTLSRPRSGKVNPWARARARAQTQLRDAHRVEYDIIRAGLGGRPRPFEPDPADERRRFTAAERRRFAHDDPMRDWL